jgi:hypothetical protein
VCGSTRKRLLLALAIVLVVPFAEARSRAARHPGPPGRFTHVFIVVLENTNAADAARQPFLARLIREGLYLRNYHGVSRPSQPNYIALVAGSTLGITSNDNVTRDLEHIGDLLERKGRSWKAYAGSYPGGCYLSATAGGGLYARKHVPFLSFANIQHDPSRCAAHVVDSGQLYADIAAGALPSYSLYIPNQNDDGHDTGIAFADRWLERTFAPLLANPRFTEGLLFVVTFDEASGSDASNRVVTVLWGDGIAPGEVSDVHYDHYDLLRTVEDLFLTGTLGRADAQARAIPQVLTVAGRPLPMTP